MIDCHCGTGAPSNATRTGAGHAHASAVRKRQRRTASCAFESGGGLRNAQHPVGDPERQVVHPPGHRHADMPEPDASGPVVPQWSASWAASPRSRSLSRDHHPYIGRVESVAGIVDLRAVRSAEGGFRDPAPWSHTNRGLGFGPQQARRVNVGRRAGGPHGGGTFLRPGVVARLSGGYVYLWGATPVRS